MARTCHAVGIGHVPGLYTNERDVLMYMIDFPQTLHKSHKYKRNLSRDAAIDYLERFDVQRSKIRLFIRAFPELRNFEPRYTSTFDQELQWFARSQKLIHGPQRRGAKANAIYKEIVSNYLPEGLMLHQVDDVTGDITLIGDQTLRVYQAMCEQSRKLVNDTLEACLTELKCRAPYVNSVEFVNSLRTGKTIKAFHSWDEFCNHTRKNPIDAQYAGKIPLLSTLLYDLSMGPPRRLSEKFLGYFKNIKYATGNPDQGPGTESRVTLLQRPPPLSRDDRSN